MKRLNGKTVVLATLLLLLIIIPQKRAEIRELREHNGAFTAEHPSFQISDNQANLSFLETTVNVTLKDGKVLTYSSAYEAIWNITGEITGDGIFNNTDFSLPDSTHVQRTSLFLYRDILRKLEYNATHESEHIIGGNITLFQNQSRPGHEIFFSKMKKSHPHFTETYNSTIVPVSAEDFLTEKYGEQYAKTFLYGNIPNITVRPNEPTSTTWNFSKGHNLLVYFNSSSESTSRSILQEAEQVQRNMDNVNILAIDVSENESSYRNVKENFDLSFYMNEQTAVPGYTGDNTTSYFGLNGISPALIYVYAPAGGSPGLIWRKTLGVESSKEITAYIQSFTKGFNENGIGSNIYSLMDIHAGNLKPGELAEVFASVSTGFGKITDYTITASIIQKGGGVIEGNLSITPTREGRVLNGTVPIPKAHEKPKKLAVTVEVSSHGIVESKRRVFEIELEGKQPAEPWGVYIGIGLAVAILIIGVLLNRRFGGETER